jgi:uncharacterized lipoprotein YddW (UPF0748 family)
MRRSVAVILLCVVTFVAPARGQTTAPDLRPPPAPREFRAAWVATVANIDWPSKPGLPTDQQQREMRAILDRAIELRLNAIIFQVRPSCDALYRSDLEPWSEFLTGAQGKAPAPMWDPLQTWIDESHARGLELHAWFNPYRARSDKATQPNAASHVSTTRPALVKKYGEYLWLDPGERDAEDHSIRVFLDVVNRYDVDGVHMDDYFYPYPVRDAAKKLVDFPDEPSWTRYQQSGGELARADWRRANVNRFIERLYGEIKRAKPHVKLGISPFGIWKSGTPPGIKGLSQYDSLYADARLWLNQGWLDYFSPQLYWAIDDREQAFPVLYTWWSGQNTKKRHLWPGISTTKFNHAKQKAPSPETLKQIEIARRRKEGPGHVHWNMSVLMDNPQRIVERLRDRHYAQPALVPASPWLDDKPPGAPTVTIDRAGDDGSVRVSISPAADNDEPAARWAVYERYGRIWRFTIRPGATTSWTTPRDPKLGPLTGVVVSAVDRCGNEGERVAVRVPPTSTTRPTALRADP